MGSRAREALLELIAELPVKERRLPLAGISTAILEGGAGAPIVLLHGPMGYAAHWKDVIRELAATHRVVVPDLPGHGSSEVTEGALDEERVLTWLRELIERTCASPPVLVGQLMGGAIAARFASRHCDRIAQLTLVDALGLRDFQPAPEFGRALHEFLAQPDERTHEELWRYCAFDLGTVQRRMGKQWAPFQAYNLDRANAPTVQAAVSTLMEHFALRAIPGEDLTRITAPVALIWGRHDLATPLAVAEAASARYGWPLQVIEDSADDPPIEQPEALVRAFRTAWVAARAAHR